MYNNNSLYPSEGDRPLIRQDTHDFIDLACHLIFQGWFVIGVSYKIEWMTFFICFI